MQQLFISFSGSASELKKNTTAYERLMEALEDYELGKIVQERQAEKSTAIEVLLDDL
ncbi:MAG: hypothetical protein Q8Q54_07445 [Methylococcales bacterium]|nr:hypothetical protein [Methylococcales bacterium]MDP3838739.1 hypothetical protein [Methylococcales bacterium]